MSRKEDVQKLIINHQRRLQKLKERQALEGFEVDARLLLEIEDIEAALEPLEQELDQLNRVEPEPIPLAPNREPMLPAPLVFLHNFGQLPAHIPVEAELLDWSDEFDRDQKPRKIPGPAVWEKKLWPQLARTARKFGRPGLIRLQQTAALSAGFAFGHIFMRVGRYQLEVAQFSPQEEYICWTSHELPPEGQSEVNFASRVMPGNASATEGVVIVSALPGRTSSALITDVGTYLGEPEIFNAFAAQNSASAKKRYNSLAIHQLLIDGFDVNDLRDICYYSLEFRPVYEQLAGLTGKKEIAHYLVEFAERQMLFEALLTIIRGKNPRRYEAREAELCQGTNRSQKFKGVLLLEGEKVTGAGQPLAGWEAATLARTSLTILRDFVSQTRPVLLHLFLATPVGLAVFLGHQWNAIGARVQCYEWAGVTGQYLPSCALDL